MAQEFDFSGAHVNMQIANLNARLTALEAAGSDAIVSHGETVTSGVMRLLRHIFGEE